MSWFIATGRLLAATGNECLRTLLLVTNNKEPLGMRADEVSSRAASVILSGAFSSGDEKSLGDIQGMVPPCQNAGLALLGVVPPSQTPKKSNSTSAHTKKTNNKNTIIVPRFLFRIFRPLLG